MKKLLLLLFLSLGFIGSTYAASRAGIALTYGFGSVAISAGLGFVLFILIKPKKDTEEKKAVYYGRLFLAYILWIQTAAIFPQFIIRPDINTFMAWLAGLIAFGFIAYVIGSVYGASKKTAVKKAIVDKQPSLFPELTDDEKASEWEYCALVTNLNRSVLEMAQHYRDRGDCENNYDENKNWHHGL